MRPSGFMDVLLSFDAPFCLISHGNWLQRVLGAFCVWKPTLMAERRPKQIQIKQSILQENGLSDCWLSGRDFDGLWGKGLGPLAE